MARPTRPDNAPRAFSTVITRGQDIVTEQTEESPFREESLVPPVLVDPADPVEMQRVFNDLYKTLLKMQDAAREATAGVRSLPPWVTIRDVTLTNGTTTVIKHKLGRPFRGWRLVRCREGSPLVYETPNSTDPVQLRVLDANQLSLVSAADITADIEVW